MNELKEWNTGSIPVRATNDRQKRCRSAQFYNVKEMDFEFFLRDLISKGLLYEAGIGTHGYLPLKSVSPTSLAFELIKFIRTS